MGHAKGLPPSPLEGFPAYGAVHDISPTLVRDFLYDFGRASDGVFTQDILEEEAKRQALADNPIQESEIVLGELPDGPPAIELLRLQVIDPNTKKGKVVEVPPSYDSRKFYRIFDPESLGVSVVEMDPSRRAAQTVRSIWEKQDFGAVEKEARNEMGRKLPNTLPRLKFNRVEGVGRRLANYPKSEVTEKLALMPDSNYSPETFNLIEDEAEIIINAIRSRLKQFMYPWDITPHLTFAVFRKEADPDQIVAIKETLNEILGKHPLVVHLGALAFRHKIIRKSKPRH